MLFNSLPFLCGFLPLTLAAFFLLGRTSHRLAALFLAVASLFFYAWWNPSYLGLLLASVVFNCGAGALIARLARRGAMGHAKLCLAGAVAGDVALLGVFKYAGFFAGVVGGIVGTSFSLGAILLPLGISFFTFTQIAFLVDTYRGKAQEYDVVRYLLFVTYFPHLIAGPILHHAQIMPQFADRRTYRPDWGNLAVGVTIFAIGLVKKVLVADNLAVIANPIFGAAQRGGHPALAEAWAGAFAFALQLYFDFSGYSDMAIGLSRLLPALAMGAGRARRGRHARRRRAHLRRGDDRLGDLPRRELRRRLGHAAGHVRRDRHLASQGLRGERPRRRQPHPHPPGAARGVAPVEHATIHASLRPCAQHRAGAARPGVVAGLAAGGVVVVPADRRRLRRRRDRHVGGPRLRISLFSVLSPAMRRYLLRFAATGLVLVAAHLGLVLFLRAPIGAEDFVGEMMVVKREQAAALASPKN